MLLDAAEERKGIRGEPPQEFLNPINKMSTSARVGGRILRRQGGKKGEPRGGECQKTFHEIRARHLAGLVPFSAMRRIKIKRTQDTTEPRTWSAPETRNLKPIFPKNNGLVFGGGEDRNGTG